MLGHKIYTYYDGYTTMIRYLDSCETETPLLKAGTRLPLREVNLVSARLRSELPEPPGSQHKGSVGLQTATTVTGAEQSRRQEDGTRPSPNPETKKERGLVRYGSSLCHVPTVGFHCTGLLHRPGLSRLLPHFDKVAACVFARGFPKGLRGASGIPPSHLIWSAAEGL